MSRFLECLGDRVTIAYPTYVELFYGIERIKEDKPNRAAGLQIWADEVIQRSKTLELTTEVARVHSEMLNCPKLGSLWMHNGRPEKPKLKYDLLMAATACVHRVPIATRNTKDFIQIGREFQMHGLYSPVTGLWVSDAESPRLELPSLGSQPSGSFSLSAWGPRSSSR